MQSPITTKGARYRLSSKQSRTKSLSRCKTMALEYPNESKRCCLPNSFVLQTPSEQKRQDTALDFTSHAISSKGMEEICGCDRKKGKGQRLDSACRLIRNASREDPKNLLQHVYAYRCDQNNYSFVKQKCGLPGPHFLLHDLRSFSFTYKILSLACEHQYIPRQVAPPEKLPAPILLAAPMPVPQDLLRDQ